MKSGIEQFITAAEIFPVAILIADAEGRIVLVNGKTETMFGYQRDELIGQAMEILIPERYRSLFQNAVFAIFRSTPAGYFTDANPALCSMLGGLPHMRGPELVERLKSRQPTMAVLYIVRFRRGRSSADEASELSGRFIQKPFRKDALLRKLEQTLARRSY